MKVRIPRQERSKETRAKIIEAAIRLFAEKGYYNTNSKEIAREAGIATGSFYAYFKDKKTLFIEVVKKYLEVTEAGIFEMQSDPMMKDKKAYIGGLLQRLFKAHQFYPEIYREVMILSYTDADIHATYEEYCRVVIENMMTMFKPFHSQLRVKDEEAAVIIIMTLLENIIHRTRDFVGGIEDERYIGELSDVICRYLFD